MAVQPILWLHEELLLLALEAGQGRPPVTGSLSHALAGALLAELLLNERARIEVSKRSKRLVVTRSSLLGEPLLDHWLERLRVSKPTTAAAWVGRVAAQRGLADRVTERLWLKGTVRREERPFLLLFTRRAHPIVNTALVRASIARLRAALLDGANVPARDLALLGLLRHAGAVRAVFNAQERKLHKKRIRQLTYSDQAAGAIADALAAVHAAIAAAG
jgi:hypothetical protein